MYLSQWSQQWSSPEFWMGLLYSLPAVLLALSVHEAAHAYAAFKAGDPTARNLGRLTLSPLKHLDPIGLFCLLFFGFGWAKPVPINPRNFKNYKRDTIMVSLAGIITNLILSFIAFGVYAIMVSGFGFTNIIFQEIMIPIIVLNITLAFFNILPIPPLDGSHVLEVFLPPKAARVMSMISRYGFLILIALLATGILRTMLMNVTGGLLSAYNAFFGLFGLGLW